MWPLQVRVRGGAKFTEPVRSWMGRVQHSLWKTAVCTKYSHSVHKHVYPSHSPSVNTKAPVLLRGGEETLGNPRGQANLTNPKCKCVSLNLALTWAPTFSRQPKPISGIIIIKEFTLGSGFLKHSSQPFTQRLGCGFSEHLQSSRSRRSGWSKTKSSENSAVISLFMIITSLFG